MPEYSYRTIHAPARGLYKEKGSKFLSFAFPVETEQVIKAKLSALKKEYFDARHHCYAWMLGADKKLFRANDDGEPNHSAGGPILGQLRSKDLTNILVVIIRYFGGVKLGVGGLISAYKAAAEDALNNAIIIEREVTVRVNLKYNYPLTPDIMRLVKEFDLKIIEQKFEESCEMRVEVRLKKKSGLMAKLKLLKDLGSVVEFEIND